MRSHCHRRTGNNCDRRLLLRQGPLQDAGAAVVAYWEGNLAETSADGGLDPVHPEANDDITQVMANPLVVAAVADRTGRAEGAAGAGGEGCSPPGRGRGHYKLIAILRHPGGAVAAATVEESRPPTGNAAAAAAEVVVGGESATPRDAAGVVSGMEAAAAAAAGGGGADSAAPCSAGRTRRKVFGMGTTSVRRGEVAAVAVGPLICNLSNIGF